MCDNEYGALCWKGSRARAGQPRNPNTVPDPGKELLLCSAGSYVHRAFRKESAMADTSTKGRIRNELNTAKFSWFHIKAILVSGVG